MNILVANDDGIEAEGIRKLVSALSKDHRIFVCAPDQQRSACSHGITIRQGLQTEPIDFPGADHAYKCTGTPVDCVKIGLEICKLKEFAVDAVFSGINHGSNMGTDTVYSGTVAAAREGAISGYPSVALSVNALSPKHFDMALELAYKAARLPLASIDRRIMLNINTPDLPIDQIKGVKFVPVGLREYREWYNLKEHDDGAVSFTYDGSPVHYDNLSADDSDVGAYQEGYASITPMQYNFTEYEQIFKVRELFGE
jgi:5'-nucleotidase